MQTVHICPHCGKAVDEEGQRLLNLQAKEKEEAKNLYQDFCNQNWFLRNSNSLLFVFICGFAIFGGYLYFHQKENIALLLFGIFVYFLAIIFFVALDNINGRMAKRKFQIFHPGKIKYLD